MFEFLQAMASACLDYTQPMVGLKLNVSKLVYVDNLPVMWIQFNAVSWLIQKVWVKPSDWKLETNS